MIPNDGQSDTFLGNDGRTDRASERGGGSLHKSWGDSFGHAGHATRAGGRFGANIIPKKLDYHRALSAHSVCARSFFSCLSKRKSVYNERSGSWEKLRDDFAPTVRLKYK